MSNQDSVPEQVAGNGLLHRRTFLTHSAALVSAGAVGLATTDVHAATRQPWSTAPGAPMSAYGDRSRFEAGVVRDPVRSAPGTTGTGASLAPLEKLEGTITPNALFFERHHSGIPDIDPDQHTLLIHGLVKRPLKFDMNALSRYPMVTRTHFLECSGNSRMLYAPEPVGGSAGSLHGLVSCAEWTGVPLSMLLDDAGIEPGAGWILAEGADAAGMSRSVPLKKAMDDAFIALYQNGERLRPGNGYPARLFLPGFEGNANVKWLQRIKVTAGPTMTKDETSRYSDLQADGKSLLFTLTMGVKSVITRPSAGLNLTAPGLYEISGLAWSGAGRIARVEVSADGGRSWSDAVLNEPVLTKSLTRFRIPWHWDGGPAVLLSRAIDDAGHVQPTREELFSAHGKNQMYHCTAIQCWGVDAGERSPMSMYKRRELPLTLAIVLLGTAASAAGESPNLGRPATAEEVAALDLSIGPDGAGLPPGRGTVREGEAIYLQKCLACHGPDGRNGPNDALSGGIGSLTSATPNKTIGSLWPYATTLFDYVRRAMPYQQPGSLTDDEVYAVTAYLLNRNGIVRDNARMDAATLAEVKMPNVDNFIWSDDAGPRP
ncbi:MAG: sulfite dehydrogenase [Gammaproteobacteria bacterium]|nr:sulfite dehydrogenase [Gammaproteobacteria bacterium]